MQLVLKKLVFVSTLGMAALSCSSPAEKETPVLPKVENTEFINFRGEQVLAPTGLTARLLNQSQEDFVRLYDSLHTKELFRTTEDVRMTYEEINNIITPFISKYPDVSIDREISKKDLKQIFQDFKSIKTVDEIREKSDIIVAYYEAFLKSEVIGEIVKYKKTKKKNARTSGIGDPFGEMTSYEESVAMNHPRYVPGYTIAAGTAKMMGGKYDDDNEGTKGDAIRHSTWNCLIIRNVIILGASKDAAVEYAWACTTAHEKNASGGFAYTAATAMDLYNNLSGRTWMEGEVGWGVGWARKMPIEATIENNMQIRAARATKFQESNYTYEICIDNGVHNNWGTLYGALTKPGYGELVYFK